jgi:hypothetical protein
MHASVTTHLKDSLTVKARLTPAKPTAARIGRAPEALLATKIASLIFL